MNAAKITYALAFGLYALAMPGWGLDPVDHQPVATLAAALKTGGQVRIAQGLAQPAMQEAKTGQVSPQLMLMLSNNKQTGQWAISVIQDKAIGSTILTGDGLQQISRENPAAAPAFDRQKANFILARRKGLKPDYYPDEIQRLTASGYQRLFTGKVKFTMNSALATAAIFQRQKIDAHIVKLTLDGKETEISQGDLRKAMTRRVKDMEARRAELQRAHGDANEIARLQGIIQSYLATTPQGDGTNEPEFQEFKPAFMDVLGKANGDFSIVIVDEDGACAEIALGGGFSVNP
jgi:hypothetical protein